MYFLALEADKAAFSLCDQDVHDSLVESVKQLQLAHKKQKKRNRIGWWLREDGMNYHWLGYFAEKLQIRDGTNLYSEVQSLRRCPPVWMICAEQTTFPLPMWLTETPPSTLLAYRVQYVKTRNSYGTWDEFGCPAWFFRVANTILHGKEKDNFFRRVQPREAHE